MVRLIMTWRHHTHHSSFFWDSDLSDERKDQIITWVASLSENEASLLKDAIKDVIAETQYDSDEADY